VSERVLCDIRVVTWPTWSLLRLLVDDSVLGGPNGALGLTMATKTERPILTQGAAKHLDLSQRRFAGHF
jgi:hypothetical protein